MSSVSGGNHVRNIFYRDYTPKFVIAAEFTSDPEEGLFEVVVAFRGNVVVLEILLPVESNLLRLHLSVLNLNLVASQNNRNVFAHAREVAMPVRHVFVPAMDREEKMEVISGNNSTEYRGADCKFMK